MAVTDYRGVTITSGSANDYLSEIVLSTDDEQGRILKFELWNGGTAVTSTTGLSARFYIDVNGNPMWQDMSPVSGTATATWSAALKMGGITAGKHRAEIRVTDSDGGIVATRPFVANVQRGVIDGADSEVMTNAEDLLAEVETINLSLASDGTLTLVGRDGSTSTSTAVPQAVALATTATNNANNAAGTANSAATDAAQAVADLQAFVPLDADNILKGAGSGAIVSVTDAYPSPLLKLTAYGNSIQNGTPTPESPVEIKSVHAVSARISGVNLIAAPTVRSSNGITLTPNDDGTVTLNGTATGNTFFYFAPDFYTTAQNYTLCVSRLITETGLSVRVRNRATTEFAVLGTDSGVTTKSFAKDVPEIITICIRVSSGATLTNCTIGVALYEGSHPDATFIPYVGSTAPLTLIDDQGVAHELKSFENYRDELVINADGSGTIYEHVLKARNNELIPFAVGSTKDWVSTDSVNRFRLSFSSIYLTKLNNNMLIKCDSIESMTWNDFISKEELRLSTAAHYTSTVNAIYVDHPTISNVNEFREYMAELNPTFVIPLTVATNTYHIPAVNMPALPDLVSNCWLSATDASGAAIPCEVGIEYRRDVNHVIDGIGDRIDATAAMIAPVENDAASANYAIGSYLVHDGVLYKVTRAIAAGETIKPGTNVTATTVMAEVAALSN